MNWTTTPDPADIDEQTMSLLMRHAPTMPSSRPMHAAEPILSGDDELVLPRHRRTIVQYARSTEGATELRLYYGDKEISFDDPGLFVFGENLAKHARFVARTAATWGLGDDWPRTRVLLLRLIDAGVLFHADEAEGDAPGGDTVRPSPLPPATCPTARDWADCAAITHELTGRTVDPGHLELVVPIFRVAHIALDAEGRQVGEANVFPRALRLDVPTEWRTCNFPGSRYQTERPMNVTALKSMRAHWPQMMAGLLRVREAFSRRFPEADGAWTVGHLERLATAVLALPTWQLVIVLSTTDNDARRERPVASGAVVDVPGHRRVADGDASDAVHSGRRTDAVAGRTDDRRRDSGLCRA